MADPILDTLTPAQLEAVTHVDGPMLVVAGAGSGKTRVVTRRIAHLIQTGAKPWQILAMTFTNKAAGEMKERVHELIGAEPRWVGTFHSLCARFLRHDLDRLNEGRTSRFTIFDTDDQLGLVKQIMKDRKIEDKRLKPRSILEKISYSKCDGLSPDEYGAGRYDDEIIAAVYREYEKTLRKYDGMDFDDLLLLTAKMLRDVPGLKEQYHERFRYLLIDEYQDTNRIQYTLMRLLTNPDQNVHVTGDPDQSIYSWRGADYRNIMDFQKDFPETRVVRLEQNYRSTKTILTAANALIRNNSERIEKDLHTENEEGEALQLGSLPSDRDEAGWVATKVGALQDEGVSLRDMAIFYRLNAQSRPFEESFISRGVPYQIIGGIRFYERKEIKDFLAHLRIVVNPRDTISLRRITNCRPTGVGEKTLTALIAASDQAEVPPFTYLADPDFAQVFTGRTTAKLRTFASWCHRLAAVDLTRLTTTIKDILDHSGLMEHFGAKVDSDPQAEERMENLQAFFNRAVEFEQTHPDATLPSFLEEIALVASIDTWSPETDQISLMTLHSAKGLEFPVVFLVGLEQGLLPHANAETRFTQEEERRLFYVGLTRAQKRAFVSHAQVRMQWGKTEYAIPSPFLREIPEEVLAPEDLTDPFGGLGPSGRTGASRIGGDRSRVGKKGSAFAQPGLDDDFLDDMDPGFDPEDDVQYHPGEEPSRSVPASGFRTGDLIQHETFGKGKILSLSGTKAVVQFFAIGTKMLYLDMARVRKI